MTYLATPEFATDWPEWARWLIGDPLAVVLYLLGALVVLAIAHAVIGHTVKRLAAKPWTLGGDGDVSEAERAHNQARREARIKTLGSVAHSTVKAVVWILTICLVLERLGVSMGLIITTLGVLGVGVGLGAQSMVKDMIAGMFILAEDQFGIGDQVDAEQASGKVVSMSLRITTLRDDDGVIWYVPNGTVTRIGNSSQHRPPATGEAATS
ncbi:MAG: mechanosensitive ion channel family protein [Micrococcales bacterium]|nr:mechanosensitive ion channel family protein [Micrococcales bacterium]